MNDASTDRATAIARRLYGPTVQYADGRTVAGRPLDTESIIAAFERCDAESRRAFWSVFAHDLTVAVRVILDEHPLSDRDIEKLKEINETFHHLTSCLDPHSEWGARDMGSLLRAIIDSSFAHDLDRWVGHALALAARTIGHAKERASVP
jgi:hypothetical protein